MVQQPELPQAGESFKGLAKHMGDTPIAPAHGIAALALDMSMKYHDMSIVKDGALYQQFKLEGKNIRTIGLDDVFADAVKIEAWLLGASDQDEAGPLHKVPHHHRQLWLQSACQI